MEVVQLGWCCSSCKWLSSWPPISQLVPLVLVAAVRSCVVMLRGVWGCRACNLRTATCPAVVFSCPRVAHRSTAVVICTTRRTLARRASLPPMVTRWLFALSRRFYYAWLAAASRPRGRQRFTSYPLPTRLFQPDELGIVGFSRESTNLVVVARACSFGLLNSRRIESFLVLSSRVSVDQPSLVLDGLHRAAE